MEGASGVAVCASAGPTVTGTYAADAEDVTFTTSDGSQDAPEPFWLIDGQLVVQGRSTVTYDRAECR